jgi:hypothetical protein
LLTRASVKRLEHENGFVTPLLAHQCRVQLLGSSFFSFVAIDAFGKTGAKDYTPTECLDIVGISQPCRLAKRDSWRVTLNFSSTMRSSV